MFGNEITDGSQVVDGPYGNVVLFSISTLHYRSILGVDLQFNNATLLQMTEPSTKSDIFAMPFDADNVVEGAYCVEGNNLYVFTLESAYPYLSTTRLAIWYEANPDRVTTMSGSVMSVPNPYESLAVAKVKATEAGSPDFATEEQLRQKLVEADLI
jgi:hypothetical protein